MSGIEITAALLIVANVALVARRSVWNYPLGIAGVILYAAVFWRARLYAEVGLQGVFLVLNIYGWVVWRRARSEADEVMVERMTPAKRGLWILICAMSSAGLGVTMARHTDAASPWWDATIAVTSLVAQYLLARRKIENWLLWIAVDAASIGLYASRGLWPTTLLYVLLFGLAVWGYRDWRAMLGSGPVIRGAHA